MIEASCNSADKPAQLKTSIKLLYAPRIDCFDLVIFELRETTGIVLSHKIPDSSQLVKNVFFTWNLRVLILLMTRFYRFIYSLNSPFPIIFKLYKNLEIIVSFKNLRCFKKYIITNN